MLPCRMSNAHTASVLRRKQGMEPAHSGINFSVKLPIRPINTCAAKAHFGIRWCCETKGGTIATLPAGNSCK